jgi:two-component system, NtrC family, nitrogen regulation sensor histidine kinase NtrY
VKLRTRLIAAFVAATIVPVALTWWTSLALLERSLELAPDRELDDLSKSLEKTAQKLYQRARTALKEDALAGRIPPNRFEPQTRADWPADVEEFYSGGQAEAFSLADSGSDIDFLKRTDDGAVVKFSAPVGDVNLKQIREQYSRARARLGQTRDRNIHRGFTYAFAAIASVIWLGALVALIWWADRLSRPVQRLTDALHRVAAGDLSTRVASTGRDDEIGVAIGAFNEMAERVEQSREKLVQVTRLASWQALARKMAHEVKNSLTPIRLTMEEIASRYGSRNDGFIDQASQIVAEEVTALEKRVRAFTELASEPPVTLSDIDLNSLIEERIAFLKAAHPQVRYETRLASEDTPVRVDSDLVRGVLTNLLENAAQAAGPGGVVLAATLRRNGHVLAEVHDSGSGLSELAKGALFEPTISFKKGGMGLGLSIARRSALLCGGDLALVDGQLGGAAFRLTLPVADQHS